MKAFVLDASLTMEWFGGTPSAGALTSVRSSTTVLRSCPIFGASK